jgi:hypothetical protein
MYQQLISSFAAPHHPLRSEVDQFLFGALTSDLIKELLHQFSRLSSQEQQSSCDQCLRKAQKLLHMKICFSNSHEMLFHLISMKTLLQISLDKV